MSQVDAALDLSHTQNIGRMIKEHFPHSQVRRFSASHPLCLFAAVFKIWHTAATSVTICMKQGNFLRLQNDGGISSDWCISGGNHSHLLGKGVCSLKKLPWYEMWESSKHLQCPSLVIFVSLSWCHWRRACSTTQMSSSGPNLWMEFRLSQELYQVEDRLLLRTKDPPSKKPLKVWIMNLLLATWLTRVRIHLG
jgi:hypothetical protein